jgi:Arc/MetJ-type ribon-helix-helix transcriptional regulator
MAMELVQVRLPRGLIERLDKLVKKGIYPNKSEAIREAVRIITETRKMIGIIPNTGDSVKEVREIRKRLSKEDPEMSFLGTYK